MDLKNKVVAITGGGRGIGLAIAKSLAEQGARVAIGSRTEAELLEGLSALNSAGGGPHLALSCDVRSQESVEAFADKITRELGTPFALIAAAGVYGEIGPFRESSLEGWQDALEINLMGVIRSVHIFARKMSKGGRVILFSGGGQAAMPNFAPYVTAKGALWRFTETVGAELARDGIFLNAIAPGAVNTRFLKDLLAQGPEKVGREFFEKSLKQRDAGGESPLKAAKLVSYLLSEKSLGLHGRTLSAVWDDYESFGDPEVISRSDLYAYRRVVKTDGQTRG